MTSLGKIAFCFPGQGSLEEGMGRDIAEAVPEAMAVFAAGSRASGLNLEALCFEGPLEALLDTERDALEARLQLRDLTGLALELAEAKP